MIRLPRCFDLTPSFQAPVASFDDALARQDSQSWRPYTSPSSRTSCLRRIWTYQLESHSGTPYLVRRFNAPILTSFDRILTIRLESDAYVSTIHLSRIHSGQLTLNTSLVVLNAAEASSISACCSKHCARRGISSALTRFRWAGAVTKR